MSGLPAPAPVSDLPGEARHGFAMHPHMIRRRWDYFVEHLLGAEPPTEHVIGEQ